MFRYARKRAYKSALSFIAVLCVDRLIIILSTGRPSTSSHVSKVAVCGCDFRRSSSSPGPDRRCPPAGQRLRCSLFQQHQLFRHSVQASVPPCLLRENLCALISTHRSKFYQVLVFFLRSWIFPCAGGVYQCTSQSIYASFIFGPQLGCPSLPNMTATLPPGTTCSLANNSCSFVADAQTCVSWLSGCDYQYSCTTEVEFTTAVEEESCSFPFYPQPPSPSSVCVPVNGSCEWYNPCRSWQGWCGGEYQCGTEAQYAYFLNGPQPLCVAPAPNATEPVPAGECVYRDGQCLWSGMYDLLHVLFDKCF